MQPTREWTCGYASASQAGDYLQVLFKATDADDKRYVLIQSQFEFPQNYDVKIEADGGEWYAELCVDRAMLDRKRMSISGRDEGVAVRIIVNHVADDETYSNLARVLETMLPKIVVQ